METSHKARLEELYDTQIRPVLQSELKLGNVMEVPKLKKIVINVGVAGSISDSKLVQAVEESVTAIAGQKAVRTKARKSIAGFKLREGMPIGVRVTLRRKKMYEFLDKLINLALPKVRDFQGVSPRLDGQGNYNLGIKDWIIFPELDQEFKEKTFGMNITLHTSAKNDLEGYELLKKFNMPFKTTQGTRK